MYKNTTATTLLNNVLGQCNLGFPLLHLYECQSELCMRDEQLMMVMNISIALSLYIKESSRATTWKSSHLLESVTLQKECILIGREVHIGFKIISLDGATKHLKLEGFCTWCKLMHVLQCAHFKSQLIVYIFKVSSWLFTFSKSADDMEWHILEWTELKLTWQLNLKGILWLCPATFCLYLMSLSTRIYNTFICFSRFCLKVKGSLF